MSSPEVPVVYHQKGILVVHKPSGLASQPTVDGSPNLFSLLQKKHPYVALHHRLDTPASGLLLLCTDKRWNKSIAQAFQQRSIKREYWVACLGDPPNEGTWERQVDGKYAKTMFHTVHRSFGYACLQIQLETGRKHQIRIHANQHGFPILGDRRYGGAAARLCSRLALHAQKISFVHPATRERVELEAALPEELHSLLSR